MYLYQSTTSLDHPPKIQDTHKFLPLDGIRQLKNINGFVMLISWGKIVWGDNYLPTRVRDIDD